MAIIRKPSIEVAPTTLLHKTRQIENTCRHYLLRVPNSGLLLSWPYLCLASFLSYEFFPRDRDL